MLPWRAHSTPGTLAPDLALLLHFGICNLANVAGTSEGTAHVRTVEVFTQIHQRKESAQYSRLHVVRQVQDAEPPLGECRGRIVLTSRNLTRRSHKADGAER